MTKRISLIAVVVCAFAAVCGLVFVELDNLGYTWRNSPRLVGQGFTNKFEKGTYIQNVKIDDYRIIVIHKEFCIYKESKGYENYWELWIGEQKDGRFAVVEQLLSAVPPDKRKTNPLFLSNRQNVSITELNRTIDNRLFPDENSRRQKKTMILKQLDVLNKK